MTVQKKVFAVTRFYETKVAEQARAWERIEQLVERVTAIPEIDTLHIIVNPADAIGSLAYLQNKKFPQVCVYDVHPWGRFVPPLNAALHCVRGDGFDAMLCVSAEMQITSEAVQRLLQHLTEDTLVVGARLEGHNFMPGEGNRLTGDTSPWNTFALWQMRALCLLGFSLLGEALWDGDAGMEEVATVALYQRLYARTTRHIACKAKVVETAGIQWNMADVSEERRDAHAQKMRSKNRRAEEQLTRACIPFGYVTHIISPSS